MDLKEVKSFPSFLDPFFPKQLTFGFHSALISSSNPDPNNPQDLDKPA